MSEVLDNNLNTDNLILNQETKAYLVETAKWAKLMAIVGIVMLGLMILASLAMGAFMGTMMSSMGGDVGGPASALGGGFISFIYIAMAIIYAFPIMYLYKFATKMKLAIANNDQTLLTESLRNLKSCYKFMGIFILIMLVFYGIGIIIAMIGGFFASTF